MQEMQNLFTYASMSTLAGAVAATILVVNFIKDARALKRLSTRYLVLLVAEGVVFLTNFATGTLTLMNIPLCILNGLLVAASAMGSWQVIQDRLFNNFGKGG